MRKDTNQRFRLDYSQQQIPVTTPDMMTSAEQTMNMSPMDLFDSIFWGEFHCGVLSRALTVYRSIPHQRARFNRL